MYDSKEERKNLSTVSVAVVLRSFTIVTGNVTIAKVIIHSLLKLHSNRLKCPC